MNSNNKVIYSDDEDEKESGGRDESMPTTSKKSNEDVVESTSKIENDEEEEKIVHKKKRRFVLFNESDDEIQDVTSNHVDSDTDSKRIKQSEGEATATSSNKLEETNALKKKALLQAAQQKKEAETASLKLFDTSDANYWSRVYSSRGENSLNFKDLLKRECGQIRPKVFQDKAINNIDFVRRMKLSNTLKFHEGCVNSLNFNRIGTLLCSGSDDHQICIYDWTRSRPILNFDSGHKSNVFQVKSV
jgi:WD40 repeat protein